MKMEQGSVRLEDGSLIRVEYQLEEEQAPNVLTPRAGELWLLEDCPEFALLNQWLLVLDDGSTLTCIRENSSGHAFTVGTN